MREDSDEEAQEPARDRQSRGMSVVLARFSSAFSASLSPGKRMRGDSVEETQEPAHKVLLANFLNDWLKTVNFPTLRTRAEMYIGALLDHHPNIRVVDNRNRNGRCVTLLGPAKRRGPPPSMIHVLHDTLAGIDSNTLQWSNALTGDFESEVNRETLLYQQCITAGNEDPPEGFTTRLVGLVDMPHTADGLGACDFEHIQTEEPTSYDPFTTVSTPKGYITNPHFDAVGARVQSIHWHGKKLWVCWPPTPQNLSKIQRSRTHNTETIEYLELFRTLEEPELLFLDAEEMPEEHFQTAINVIHACFSLTASCHTGAMTHTLADLEDAKRIFSWANKFAQEFIRASGHQGRETLQQNLNGFERDIQHWENIAKDPNCSRGEKREVREMVRSLKDTIEGFGTSSCDS
jgi:hypothetical protein